MDTSETNGVLSLSLASFKSGLEWSNFSFNFNKASAFFLSLLSSFWLVSIDLDLVLSLVCLFSPLLKFNELGLFVCDAMFLYSCRRGVLVDAGVSYETDVFVVLMQIRGFVSE